MAIGCPHIKARGYPHFLYSNPQNTKAKGPFIVHTIYPRMICRIIDYDARTKTFGIEILQEIDDWGQGEADIALNKMRNWLFSQIMTGEVVI